MPVFKYLDTSTNAISENDTIGLRNKDTLPMRVIDHEYGWWINVQHDDETFTETMATLTKLGFTKGFIKLMTVARAEDCNWINLDADGEAHPGLKKYDWPSSKKQKHVPPAERTMYTRTKGKRRA